MSRRSRDQKAAIEVAAELLEAGKITTAIDVVRKYGSGTEAVLELASVLPGVNMQVAGELLRVADMAVKAGASYKVRSPTEAPPSGSIPFSGKVEDGEYHTVISVEMEDPILGGHVFKGIGYDSDHPLTAEEIGQIVEDNIDNWTNDYFGGNEPTIIDIEVLSVVKGA